MTRTEYIEELARRIAAANRQEVRKLGQDARLRYPYYLLNTQQNAVHGEYVKFMAANGLQYGPPGDEERLRWELSMFSSEALRRLGEYYREVQTDGLRDGAGGEPAAGVGAGDLERPQDAGGAQERTGKL